MSQWPSVTVRTGYRRVNDIECGANTLAASRNDRLRKRRRSRRVGGSNRTKYESYATVREPQELLQRACRNGCLLTPPHASGTTIAPVGNDHLQWYRQAASASLARLCKMLYIDVKQSRVTSVCRQWAELSNPRGGCLDCGLRASTSPHCRHA